MELLWHELMGGLPDRRQLAFVLIRVIAAALLGGIVGLQRERAGKPAGLRTHMLVCLGTAVVVSCGFGRGYEHGWSIACDSRHRDGHRFCRRRCDTEVE